jgi:excinuclease ABC subunit C
MSFDPKELVHYPKEPGIYLMKNGQGKVIYVGKAKNLQARLKQYFVPGRDSRKTIPLLLKELCSIDTIVVQGEKEALILENTQIKEHRPKFNILLRDDKNYISLSIQPKEPWPKLRFERFSKCPKDGALHFGPYTSAYAARQTFDLMAKLFPLRQCSDAEFKRRTRPCLLYDIKRCIGPCVNKCTKEEYTTFVEGAIDFLEGDTKNLITSLKQKMQIASDNLEFEQAAALLKTIEQIKHVSESAHLSSQAGGKDVDVIGIHYAAGKAALTVMLFRQGSLIDSSSFFFEEVIEDKEEMLSSFILQCYGQRKNIPKEIILPFPLPNQTSLSLILQETHKKSIALQHPKVGQKTELLTLANKNAKATFEQKASKAESTKQILLSLQETLYLTRFPRIIECFDTSNLSGSHLVAAQVCFIDGIYCPKKTRLYHIKDIHKNDDYAALHQALTRRLLRAKEEKEFPDLLIIDGGIGQLNVALDVLKELDIINIDVISLVKDKARHDKGMTLERVYCQAQENSISFPFNSPLLFFLQNIRDKVHEKAIGFYRKTKAKTTHTSILDSIAGIGPIKKRNLLKQFGSIHNILEQSDEMLLTVPGITKKDIKNLREVHKK